MKKSTRGWQVTTNSNKFTFPTIRANFGVVSNNMNKNKYYYEVSLESQELFQIGIANNKMVFNVDGINEQGCGDDKFSWSVDLYRLKSWHNGAPRNYAPKNQKQWKIADRIGVGLDLSKKCIEFFFNGTSMGIAYSILNSDNDAIYMPCISLSHHNDSQRLDINPAKLEIIIDSKHFYYKLPKGYKAFDFENGDAIITRQINSNQNNLNNAKVDNQNIGSLYQGSYVLFFFCFFSFVRLFLFLLLGACN